MTNEKKTILCSLIGTALLACSISVRGQESLDFTAFQKKAIIEKSSFQDTATFYHFWNDLYPWGDDHNGSARMKTEKIYLENGELHITADRLHVPERKSSKDPHLTVVYHSGAIHSKESIQVDDNYPIWELSGYFQAPTAKGTWPAFWITGSETWPPESDILEFKGDDINWQNTVSGKDWRNTDWQTEKTKLPTTDKEWHRYTLVMRKLNEIDVELLYYIDEELKASHTADFVGKPFHIIVNLQMEGASGPRLSGPAQAVFKAKEIEVNAYRNK